jgi:hypothetical protein
MAGDVIAAVDEQLEGTPLLVPAMRGGEIVLDETLEEISRRSAEQLEMLPEELRLASGDERPKPYPVAYSERLRSLAAA